MKTPNKEEIIAAAKTSPEARAALKKLFPDVFDTPQISESLADDISDSNNYHREAAEEIAPNVNGAFLNVMNWSGDDVPKETLRRSFLLSNKEDTRWEIKEVDRWGYTIQILCPVEYKKP